MVLSSYLKLKFKSQTEIVRSSLHETKELRRADQNNLLTEVPCPAWRALSITLSRRKDRASQIFTDLSMLQVAKNCPSGLKVMWLMVNRCATIEAASW